MSEGEAHTMELVVESQGTSVIRQQEAAALDVQVSTAKAYPRSVQAFQADLEAWCTLNVDVADECFYSRPQGGSNIIGPSIRFAELVQAAYKNLTTDAKVIGEDDGHIIVEATCRDMERNVASRSQVRRSILTRDGKRYQTSMVENTINAGMAIARRNVIFQTVPKALWQPIWQKARAVAIGDSETFAARRTEILGELRELGTNMENVKHFLGGKQPKDIDADELLLLRLKLKSIKAKETTIDTAFPAPVGPDPEASKQSASAAGEALKKASEPEVDPETGEVIPDHI